MSCKWGGEYADCQAGKECLYCVTEGLRYKPPKKRHRLKVNTQKPDGRQGSSFEYANHKRNEEMLVKTKMTLNSGATAKEKGDENILGIIRVMEELKTQEAKRGRGCKSFAVQRHWLNKLHVEALRKNMEFWYLVFAFNEDEGAQAYDPHHFDDGNPAGNVFAVVEKGVLMDMVRTMVMDRQKAELCDGRVDMYQKKATRAEAENVFLKARIAELESQLHNAEQEVPADKLVEKINEVSA